MKWVKYNVGYGCVFLHGKVLSIFEKNAKAIAITIIPTGILFLFGVSS